MGKFGCKENFDVYIYIEGREKPFVLDSVNRFDIHSDNDGQFNRFHILDGLIDTEFINAVLGGMFANKFCRIVCKSTFRGLDGIDYPAKMTVKGAVLVKYNFTGAGFKPSTPNIVFEADFFDSLLMSNTKLVVEKND